MAMELLCPECESILTAPDEVLGEIVRCEECHSLFTAKKSVRQQLLEDDNDVYDHPHSRRMLAKTEPVARPFRTGLMLVGCFSLLICGTCLLSVIYLLVANPPAVAKKPEPIPPWMLQNPAPVPQPVAPPFAQQPNNVGVARAPQFPWEGDQFEISNPRWDGRPGDFSIDFVSLNDRMFLGNYNVHCKHDDGSVSKADIRLFNSQRGTITIRTFAMEFGRPKKQKQAMEIWIESGFGGQKVSNILYLD